MGKVLHMHRPQWIGRYEVVEVIGTGAAGVVYLARDPLIDRMVAVKVLRSDLGDQSANELRIRFLREARAAGRLSHPNIVTVYDVGEDTAFESAFIAMEHLEGRTLKDFIERGVRLDVRRVAQLAVILANALDYAHRNGVIHRDVKPSNIILTRDSDLKITDFGIARLGSSDLTYDGAVIGTPNYMSPEQISGKSADGRSDLYSLGVILYELVTGQRPFGGESIPEISLNITTQTPPDPALLRPGLPAALSTILQRCLERDPAHRYQTGSELVDALVAADLSASSAELEGSSGATSVVDGHEVGVDEPDLLTDVAFDFMATRAVQQSLRTRSHDSQLARIFAVARRATRRRWFWPAMGLTAVLMLGVLWSITGEPEPEVVNPVVERVVEPPIEPAPAEKVVETPPGFHGSVLEVSYQNRVGSGFMTLALDGGTVWSQGLAPLGEDLGQNLKKALLVPNGFHSIEIHIVGESSDIDVSTSLEGDFRAGGTRRLVVDLDPETEVLQLSWGG